MEFVDLKSDKIEKNQAMSFKMPDIAYSVWGGKWKMPVLMYLFLNRKNRNYFMEIKRDTPGISANMLTKALRSLEMNKLVKRIVHDTKPVTVEYAITEHGKIFIPMVKALIECGRNHRKVMDSK